MADTTELATAGGVLLILLAVVFYNHLQVSRGARRPAVRQPLASASMLGRYATHRGAVVGEVVGITVDRLVLRQAGTHKAVPLARARHEGDDVVLEGDIDWAQAEADGKAWADTAAGAGPAEASGAAAGAPDAPRGPGSA